MMALKPLRLTQIIGLGLYLCLPVFAGTKDGGGTNITAKDNELTDFAKFREDFGSKQIVINPREFKPGKDKQKIYESIRPMIEHADYHYPGLEAYMNEALDKTWVAIDKEFPSRNENEKKVISQLPDAIYLNLAWLKSTPPEKLQQAFLHELVRHASFRLLTRSRSAAEIEAFLKDPEQQKLEDDLTELLTPPIYKKMPQNVLGPIMEKAARIVAESREKYEKEKIAGVTLLGRKEAYEMLRVAGAADRIRFLCNSTEPSLVHTISSATAIEGTELKKGLRNFFREDHRYLVPDQSMRELFDFLLMLISRQSLSAKVYEVNKSCGKMKNNSFLKEFIQEEGKLTKQARGADEIPTDESQNDNGSAE